MTRSHSPLIHIGFPGALATWLQERLFIPEQGFIQLLGSSAAEAELIHPPQFEFRNARLCSSDGENPLSAPRDDEKVPVVTCEHLAGALFPGFGAERSLLADRIHHCFPTGRVLLVIREQGQLMRALYSHMVQTAGMPHSLQGILRHTTRYAIPRFSPAYLRYHGMVRYYQWLFGEDRLLVLPYELFRENPDDFVRHIRDFAGCAHGSVETPAADPDPVDGRGGRLPSLGVLRLANRHLVRGPFNPRGWVRDSHGLARARHKAGAFLDRWLPKALDARLERRSRAIISEALQGTFADSNRQLEELTGLPLRDYGYEL